MFVGILDGFGLTMFLPLLQIADGNSNIDSAGLGNLSFLVDLLNYLGIGRNLIGILSLLAIFFILKGVFKLFSQWYNVKLQQYFISRIRVSSLRALNNMSFKAFVLSDVGRIQNTLSGEVNRVANANTMYFRSLEQFILVIVYMAFAFFVDIRFALLVSAGGFLTNLLYKQIYIKTKSASKKVTGETHIFQGMLIQHIAFFKYLKATGFLKVFGKKLEKSIINIENSNKLIGFYSSILSSAREPLLIIVVCCVIIVQTSFLGGTLGPILISLLFFYRALSSLVAMQSTWNTFLGASGSLENMTEFQKELTSNREETGTVKINSFDKNITLEGASFSYNEDTRILDNIDLIINKRETIAFVGESGSGKSTLVNIIAGLFPVDEGKMLIDDIDSKDLDISSYQQKIGFVTQDPVIFNDSIFNNVTLWAPKTNENLNKFWNAVSKASMREYLLSLPDKEEQLLGNNGINLSGGQKQRISIARELYKDIEILILDEATSALDSETENIIQKNIDSLKGYYTIFIVAHRLATIKKADNIVFMQNGQIIKVAPFDDMVEHVSKFRRMVELQKL